MRYARSYNIPDDDLTDSIKFMYEIQDVTLDERIPEADLEILRSYQDPEMRDAIEAVAMELMVKHKALAESKGMKTTAMALPSYIELVTKLCIYMMRKEKK